MFIFWQNRCSTLAILIHLTSQTSMSLKVSHHPPIGAAHAENAHFTYDIVSAPKTKFLGNSADIYPYGLEALLKRISCYLVVGRSHIKLKKSGEVFSIIPPTSRVCNLIIGRTWIDTFGKMSVINITTGDRHQNLTLHGISLLQATELIWNLCPAVGSVTVVTNLTAASLSEAMRWPV